MPNPTFTAPGPETPLARPGLSLVEVMVAIILVSTAVLAAGGLVVSTAQIERLASTRREMAEAGESKLEQLRAYADARTADTVQLAIGGSLVADSANHFGAMQTPSGKDYRLRWVVRAGPGGTRHVRLRVEPVSATARGALRRLDSEAYIMILR